MNDRSSATSSHLSISTLNVIGCVIGLAIFFTGLGVYVALTRTWYERHEPRDPPPPAYTGPREYEYLPADETGTEEWRRRKAKEAAEAEASTGLPPSSLSEPAERSK